MSNIFPDNNKESRQSDYDNGDIDIKLLIGFFLRNKIFIGFLSMFSFICFYFYSLSMKKIWEGKFEIVLASENNNSLSQIANSQVFQNLNLTNLQDKTDLNTEVGILKSPSVLLPVFNYVNSNHKKLYPKKSDLVFSSWKNKSLKIDLKDKTSILSISYKDSNKEFILPVLDKISKDYQLYSGNNRTRNLNLNKKFLEEQVKKYKIKSSNSLKMAQDFAMKQDLINVFSKPKGEDMNTGLESNISIEAIRVTAANKIREIDLQIKKINQIGNDFDELQYFSSNIPSLVGEGLPQVLKEIEDELTEKSNKYKQNDKEITKLIEYRKVLIGKLRKRSIGILKANRSLEEAKMISATRSKGVILKYKDLIREAVRDENTLEKLEDQLRIITLEKSIIKDPWKLITNPTLKISPVGPNKKKIALIGLFAGFTISSLIIFIKENNSGLIYTDKKLEKLLNTKVLLKIDSNSNIDDKNYNITLLKYYFDEFNKSKINFIIKLNSEDKIVEEYLQDVFTKSENYEINEISKGLKNSNELFLITKLGLINKKDIKLINMRLNQQKSAIKSIILINDK